VEAVNSGSHRRSSLHLWGMSGMMMDNEGWTLTPRLRISRRTGLTIYQQMWVRPRRDEPGQDEQWRDVPDEEPDGL
jgi:hypothetical protein